MRVREWRSSGGIGTTVHLAVDWDHGESPPHGRLADLWSLESALLPSDVDGSARTQSWRAFRWSRRTPLLTYPESPMVSGRAKRSFGGRNAPERKNAAEKENWPPARRRADVLAVAESGRSTQSCADIWDFGGGTNGVGVNYWGGDFRTNKSLAPHLGHH